MVRAGPVIDALVADIMLDPFDPGQMTASKAGLFLALGRTATEEEGILIHNVTSIGADDRAARAAWSLLFYALWHRRHILLRPPEGNVFETLAGPL